MTGHVLETAQPDRSQRLPDRITRRRLVQGAQPGEIFFGSEQPFDARRMADPQQVARQFAALAFQRPALEQHLAGGRLHQTGQQPQQAGLAAAIGAGDLQHFPFGYPQV